MPEAPPAPTRRLTIVTCMDARLDPLALLGLEPGDAHVLRNAGGIVTGDVLRSLAVSHWLTKTERVAVIGHTGCGMVTFENEGLRERIAAAGGDATEIDFLPFTAVESSVRESVRRVRESPLFRAGYSAHGYVYEIGSGALRELR